MLHQRSPNQLVGRLRPAVFITAIVVSLAAVSVPRHAAAGTLTSVSPAGASATITINVTGTGFNPTANNNEVSFITPTGTIVTARGSSIVVVNAGTGVRRLSVVVPAGVPTGRVALRVRNTVTGETSEGQSIDLVEIYLGNVTSAVRGAANVAVRITGSSNAQFTGGNARASFGAGVTVHSTTVESATSVVASISVSASAALGPRTVGVITNTQTTAVGGFTIAEPPPPNRAPTITSSPITSALEGQPYAYDVNATDPDGSDVLSYALTQAPAGMAIQSASGLIAWTPAATHVPSQAVTVQVSDGKGGVATQSFTVAVTLANRAPHITSAPVTTAREQLIYNYQVQAADQNNDALTYALTSAPVGMTISAAGLITWTPPSEPPPTVHVVVAVSDPSATSDTQAFDIAITRAPRVNQPPRVTSTPTVTGQVSQPYAYDVNADDPDAGDVLSFQLVQPPQGMTINGASGLISWTPGAGQAGAFAVDVRVSDGTNTVRHTFELTISGAPHVNRAPSAHAGGPYHGEAGTEIAFDGSLSTDPDGDALVYSWNFGDGSGSGSGPSPRHVYAAAGSFTVTLVVTDGRGGESTRSTSVSIGAAGDRSPPAVTILGPR